MHAKMTRSRKKCFIATIQNVIEELETENQKMRNLLENFVAKSTGNTATGASGSIAPAVAASTVPDIATTTMVTPAASPQLLKQRAHPIQFLTVADPAAPHDEASSSSSSSSLEGDNSAGKQQELLAPRPAPIAAFSTAPPVNLSSSFLSAPMIGGSRPLKKRKKNHTPVPHGFSLDG